MAGLWSKQMDLFLEIEGIARKELGQPSLPIESILAVPRPSKKGVNIQVKNSFGNMQNDILTDPKS